MFCFREYLNLMLLKFQNDRYSDYRILLNVYFVFNALFLIKILFYLLFINFLRFNIDFKSEQRKICDLFTNGIFFKVPKAYYRSMSKMVYFMYKKQNNKKNYLFEIYLFIKIKNG